LAQSQEIKQPKRYERQGLAQLLVMQPAALIEEQTLRYLLDVEGHAVQAVWHDVK
jgi:hypothetical protein